MMDDLTRLKLVAQVKRDEGVRLTMYLDSEGIPTIGVGHNLRDDPISTAAAEQILADDLATAEGDLTRTLPWVFALSMPRYAALVNITFNMGIGHLLTFRNALAALQAGDYIKAAAEFRDSAWDRDEDHDRAQRLAQQIETDAFV